jgi:GDP-mannose pyrophosphatase NudK
MALLYSRSRRVVVLTRQFRLPVMLEEGSDGVVVEAPGGLIERDSPLEAIRRETEEETGYRLVHFEALQVALMSPALAAERVHFFTADIDGAVRVHGGGGRSIEGEDLEIFETSWKEAFAMIDVGAIVDGRTVLLLHLARARLRPEVG